MSNEQTTNTDLLQEEVGCPTVSAKPLDEEGYAALDARVKARFPAVGLPAADLADLSI